jgi:hypothetical protein
LSVVIVSGSRTTTTADQPSEHATASSQFQARSGGYDVCSSNFGKSTVGCTTFSGFTQSVAKTCFDDDAHSRWDGWEQG